MENVSLWIKINWKYASTTPLLSYVWGLVIHVATKPYAYSVKYKLTAYKQFFQLIRLCKPLIKWLTWSHVSALGVQAYAAK